MSPTESCRGVITINNTRLLIDVHRESDPDIITDIFRVTIDQKKYFFNRMLSTRNKPPNFEQPLALFTEAHTMIKTLEIEALTVLHDDSRKSDVTLSLNEDSNLIYLEESARQQLWNLVANAYRGHLRLIVEREQHNAVPIAPRRVKAGCSCILL